MQGGAVHNPLKGHGLCWIVFLSLGNFFKHLIQKRFELAPQNIEITAAVSDDVPGIFVMKQGVEDVLEREILVVATTRLRNRKAKRCL